jgi:hypothetical protein
MSDRDRLTARFAAFREASIATTVRPSVATVRRRVARRDAARTAAVGLLVALVAGTGLWLTRHATVPAPTLPPSPTPTVQFSDLPHRPNGQPGPSASSASADPTSRLSPTCGPQKPSDPYVGNGDPLVLTDSSYFQRCPNARVRVWMATYEWDVNRQQYVRAHFDLSYLTAQSPTEPKPAPNLDPIASVCGYGYALGSGPTDPPTALPTGMPGSAIDRYWYDHYPPTIEAFWNIHTQSELSSVAVCQPPKSPSP